MAAMTSELRIDPSDGQPRTFNGLRAKYLAHYTEAEVLAWWGACKRAPDLQSLLAPLRITWPEHWPEGGSATAARIPMPPPELVEESCGPQGDWFLGHSLRALPGLRLREAVESARHRNAEVLAELPRCRFRVINLAGPRGERRRSHIERTCFTPLRRHFPGLDLGYTDGVVAKDLAWVERAGKEQRRHFEKEIKYNGRIYVADQSMWHVPSRNEQVAMTRNGERYGFVQEQFHAFLKGEDEPCSWGYTGCQMAHVEAWRAAYDAGVDWFMIAEDDVLPIPLFGMDWADVWAVVAQEVCNLRRAGEDWDLLYVGKGSATSREGDFVTPLVVRAGYNLKMHCYCLSRRGLERMIKAELSYQSIRPQDEILAALSIQGRHPRECIEARIRQHFSHADEFRAVAFAFWGIVFQLQSFKLIGSCAHLCDEETAVSAIHTQGDLAQREGFGEH